MHPNHFAGDEIAFTEAELFAVLLARDMADGERAINGTNTDIQIAACNLARQLQAPDLWWVSGPGGCMNPHATEILPAVDHRYLHSSEAVMDLPAMVDFIDWKVHFFDFAILTAIQVDRFGNINTTCVGPYEAPRLRGPGIVGISALCALAKRFNVIMRSHTRSSFVERVDFLSGPGHLSGGTSRTDEGLPPGGTRYVISPLGVFGFAPHSKSMRIVSLHAGIGIETVERNTAFELIVPDPIPVTPAPTAQELQLLRTRVDRTGRLRT